MKAAAATLADAEHLGVVLDIQCPGCGQTLLSVADESAVQCEYCEKWFNVVVTVEIEEES